MKPFVKWAGGKRQFIKMLLDISPNKVNTYIEPFVGGGALLYNLKPKKIIINDINKELMDSYRIIKGSFFNKKTYKTLLNKLDEHEASNNKEYFLRIRSNTCIQKTDIAARFIYLNKAGFNGLYRVNSKDEFNVPFNGKDNVNTYEISNIEKINIFLRKNKAKILCGDYKETFKLAKKDDFIFVDPPYDYDGKGFTSYSNPEFGKEQQKELFQELKKLDKKGIKWILCNHPTKLISELYSGFNKIELSANRNISSKSSGRSKGAREVFYFNYDIDNIILKRWKND